VKHSSETHHRTLTVEETPEMIESNLFRFQSKLVPIYKKEPQDAGRLQKERQTDSGLHRVQFIENFLTEVWSWVTARQG
jgi:hypothetical protein